jgi:AcrR family transcriptional regulator
MSIRSSAPLRSDTERNRRQIIAATARLFAARTGQVNMSAIAKEAEVSPATVYRQFDSIAEILAAFRHDVGTKLLEFSKEQTETGLAGLDAISRRWISLVIEHGEAMVPMRSRRGYLNRLREKTEYLMPQAMALGEVLSQSCAELGIEDLGEQALFLWNTLFDPREILDLVQTAEMSEEEVGTRLLSGLHGLLRGWASAI